MDYTTILNSNNDVILSFTYNDSSKQLEVKANLKRDTVGTNLLKIGGTGWYVDTAKCFKRWDIQKTNFLVGLGDPITEADKAWYTEMLDFVDMITNDTTASD